MLTVCLVYNTYTFYMLIFYKTMRNNIGILIKIECFLVMFKKCRNSGVLNRYKI